MTMSTTTFVMMAPHSLACSLQIKPRRRESKTPILFKHGSCFLVNQGLSYLSKSRQRAATGKYSKMDFALHCSVLPGAPLPSGPPPNWQGWMLSAIVTIILPFCTHKWGPLFKLTKQVEAMLAKIILVTEVIEKVAEEVEKAAEEVADQLQKGGKLRDAAEFVENAAKEIAKDIHIADQFLHKVEEVEKEVESFMESATLKKEMESAPLKNEMESANDRTNGKAE